MVTIPQGRYIAVSTQPDLSDKRIGKAWATLRLSIANRIRIEPHPDGTDRWVFSLLNLFIEVSPSTLVA